VGTRFICATESAASDQFRETVLKARALDTARTLSITGRPLRVYTNAYVKEWETTKKGMFCFRNLVVYFYTLLIFSRRSVTPEYTVLKVTN
jgi:NAD(P)H-dependent flavin oxidoreductase YrpB (nitropropane dioxygenase family)